MKRIIYISLFVIVFSQIALADDKIVVENLLKEKIDSIIATLEIKDLDNENKEKKIEDIVDPIINFHVMSMLVLGKDAWISLEKQDRKRFVELFTMKIKQTLISSILKYADEKIIIEKSTQVDEKKVNILTSVVSKDQNIPVLFMFFRSGNKWNIYDVEVKDVSILKNFIAQYTESLKKMTAEELIVSMEKSDLSK